MIVHLIRYVCDQCESYVTFKSETNIAKAMMWLVASDFYGNEIHLCQHCKDHQSEQTRATIAAMKHDREGDTDATV